MRSSATRGTGQLRLNSVMSLASAIVIIGRARAFRRYHGSAQRILRRTLYRECGTLVRLFDALQNQPADALRRLVRRFSRKGITPVGIVFLKAAAQLEAAGGNLAQPAPLAVHHLEHFDDAFLRRAVSFPARGA